MAESEGEGEEGPDGEANKEVRVVPLLMFESCVNASCV